MKPFVTGVSTSAFYLLLLCGLTESLFEPQQIIIKESIS